MQYTVKKLYEGWPHLDVGDPIEVPDHMVRAYMRNGLIEERKPEVLEDRDVEFSGILRPALCEDPTCEDEEHDHD